MKVFLCFDPVPKYKVVHNWQNLSKMADLGVFWVIEGKKLPTLAKKCLAQLKTILLNVLLQSQNPRHPKLSILGKLASFGYLGF